MWLLPVMPLVSYRSHEDPQSQPQPHGDLHTGIFPPPRTGCKVDSWPSTERSFYRPQMKFAKVMFWQVSVCPHGGEGACMVALEGACVVFSGGLAWFFQGAMHGFFWGRGACVFFWGGGYVWLLQGGMCGCSGGCACFFPGGVHGFSWGHVWFFPGGVCIGYDEIRSMSGRYASYWNAFLLLKYIYRAKAMSFILGKFNLSFTSRIGKRQRKNSLPFSISVGVNGA